MRRHGWGGDLPTSDADAMARILEATVACIEEKGRDVDIAAVADRLRVTRQTIYRYFPSRQALLAEAAQLSVNALLERLQREMATYRTRLDRLVHGLAYLVNEMRTDRHLSAILSPDLVLPLFTQEASVRQAAAALEAFELVPGERGCVAEPLARQALGLMAWCLLDTALLDDRDAMLAYLRFCLAPHFDAACR